MASKALGPTDLSSLSAYELGVELSKIDHDMALFSVAAVTATRELATVEVQELYEPSLDAKAQIKIQRATLKAAEIQMRTLRYRQSRIQTILRTIP